MNPKSQAAAQAAPETTVEEPEAAQPPAENQTPAPAEQTTLTKFDPAMLKGIQSAAVVDPGAMAFMPQNMAEAFEFAKMMALSNFVPPHLRGKGGDCLAVVLQSARWGADPYAVANKTYFVNNRMAFEAQLVNAVVNSSRILDGRLQVSWKGEGNLLECTVRGRIKGDSDVHELIQEIGTITTKNSPLWKQSPRVQLAYYTSRAWARLFTPEVLLGIYTPDEMESVSTDGATPQVVIPPRPTRESTASAAEIEQARKEDYERSAAFRGTMAGEPRGETVDHDPETGEVEDQKGEAEIVDYSGTVKMLLAKIEATSRPKVLDAAIEDFAAEIKALETDSKPDFDTVQAAIAERRKYFAR